MKYFIPLLLLLTLASCEDGPPLLESTDEAITYLETHSFSTDGSVKGKNSATTMSTPVSLKFENGKASFGNGNWLDYDIEEVPHLSMDGYGGVRGWNITLKNCERYAYGGDIKCVLSCGENRFRTGEINEVRPVSGPSLSINGDYVSAYYTWSVTKPK